MHREGASIHPWVAILGKKTSEASTPCHRLVKYLCVRCICYISNSKSSEDIHSSWESWKCIDFRTLLPVLSLFNGIRHCVWQLRWRVHTYKQLARYATMDQFEMTASAGAVDVWRLDHSQIVIFVCVSGLWRKIWMAHLLARTCISFRNRTFCYLPDFWFAV